MSKIHKNILSADSLKNIQSIFMGKNNQVPWLLEQEIAYKGDKGICFQSNIYQNNEVVNPGLYKVIFPLFNFLEKTDLCPLIIHRAKANMYLKTPILEEHGSHKDYENTKKMVKGFVFMINSNDGFTRIGNTKAFSIENTGVIFNSCMPHNSTGCTNQEFGLTINYEDS